MFFQIVLKVTSDCCEWSFVKKLKWLLNFSAGESHLSCNHLPGSCFFFPVFWKGGIEIWSVKWLVPESSLLEVSLFL